jgi:hypothetical protein
VRIGGPHNLFALRKKIGLRGSSQLPVPCRLVSASRRSNYGVGNVTLALFWGYRNSGTWAASFRPILKSAVRCRDDVSYLRGVATALADELIAGAHPGPAAK